MRLIKLLSFLLLLSSCRTTKDIYGSYYSGIYSLELKEDNSFLYRENRGLSNRISDGVWEKITEGKLVLKSRSDINQIPITFSNERDMNLSEGVIQFTIENKERLNKDCIKGINLILNDNVSIPLKGFGTHTLSIEYNVQTIRVELLLDDLILVGSNKILTTENFIIGNPIQNKISIISSFTDDLFNYITINSDTIVIKGNKVEWLGNDNKILVK